MVKVFDFCSIVALRLNVKHCVDWEVVSIGNTVFVRGIAGDKELSEGCIAEHKVDG